MFTGQRMCRGPRTLALRQNLPCVQREPTGREIIVIVIERVIEREEQEREMSRERENRHMREERDTRREGREKRERERESEGATTFTTFPRVYIQNARVLCDTGVLNVQTGAFFSVRTRI